MFERSEKFGENQKFVSGVAKMGQKIEVGNEVKRQQLIKICGLSPGSRTERGVQQNTSNTKNVFELVLW
jgi:hypothetical protein